MTQKPAVSGEYKGSLILFTAFSTFTLVVFLIITANFHYMWDFKLYYWGTISYIRGMNPLDVASLKEVMAGGSERPIFSVGVLEVGREFALIPSLFRVYALFIPLGIEKLYDLFLIVKLVALNVLFVVWFRYVAPPRQYGISINQWISTVSLSLVTLFSWNQAIFLDIEAGNVTVFEQCFIWGGVAFYLRRRFFLFSLFVALASLWKLVPILFLFLLFPLLSEKESRALGAAALCFGVGLFFLIHLLSFYFDTGTYRYFIGALMRFSDEERGVFNPCVVAVIGDFLDLFAEKKITTGNNMVFSIYSTYLGVVTIVGVLYVKALRRFSLHKDPVKIVMFTFLAFALIAPRFKDYSYILLIVPVLYLLCGKGQIEERIMLAILVTCPPFFAYYNYLVVWVCFLFFIWQEEKKMAAHRSFPASADRSHLDLLPNPG